MEGYGGPKRSVLSQRSGSRAVTVPEGKQPRTHLAPNVIPPCLPDTPKVPPAFSSQPCSHHRFPGPPTSTPHSHTHPIPTPTPPGVLRYSQQQSGWRYLHHRHWQMLTIRAWLIVLICRLPRLIKSDAEKIELHIKSKNVSYP